MLIVRINEYFGNGQGASWFVRLIVGSEELVSERIHMTETTLRIINFAAHRAHYWIGRLQERITEIEICPSSLMH